MKVYGIIGASGFGSEVMPLLEKNISSKEADFFYIDSDPSKKKLNNKEVLSEESFLKLNYTKKFYNIAISDPQIRHEVHIKMVEEMLSPISIFSDDLDLVDNVKFGEGAIILPHSLFTSNVSIGNFFHCNPKCSIAHDTVIGNFVTLAPGVLVNGNVFIDDLAYIGAGAIIKQGISIGKGAIVGMGAVVIRDVRPHTTVVGNPAREI